VQRYLGRTPRSRDKIPVALARESRARSIMTDFWGVTSFSIGTKARSNSGGSILLYDDMTASIFTWIPGETLSGKTSVSMVSRFAGGMLL